MPDQLYRVDVWGSGGVRIVLLGSVGCVFRIFVLGEAVAVGIYVTKKGEESLCEDVLVHLGIHNPIKDAYSGAASRTDPSPHMHLHWVLRSVGK